MPSRPASPSPLPAAARQGCLTPTVAEGTVKQYELWSCFGTGSRAGRTRHLPTSTARLRREANARRGSLPSTSGGRGSSRRLSSSSAHLHFAPARPSRRSRLHSGKRCAVEVVPQLYDASEQELLEQLQALPESVSSVMLIGHNPGYTTSRLSSPREVLIYRSSRRNPRPVRWPRSSPPSEGWTALGPGAAELVDYVVPRQLG
jgi:hypothetical protein